VKIIIHSLDELLQLAALVRGGSSTTKVGEITQTLTVDATAACEALREAVQSAAHSASDTDAVTVPAHPDTTEAGLSTTDADGAPHNTDWHSDPAKINADGTWRARRKRDEAAYKDWLLSLAVEVAEAAVAADAGEELVATETHALPQDDRSEMEKWADSEEEADQPYAAGDTVPTVDLVALLAASQEAAQDAPDGTIDLLNRGKDFIKEYGTARFEALKAAVAPLEDGTGKPVPSLTPGERRLLRACMDNYPRYV